MHGPHQLVNWRLRNIPSTDNRGSGSSILKALGLVEMNKLIVTKERGSITFLERLLGIVYNADKLPGDARRMFSNISSDLVDCYPRLIK